MGRKNKGREMGRESRGRKRREGSWDGRKRVGEKRGKEGRRVASWLIGGMDASVDS